MKNRSMPPNSIIPVLSYQDVDAATSWLCSTLGFRVRWKAGSHRAQLMINDSAVAITETLQAVKSQGITLIIQVDNVNAHYEHAHRAGAKILTPLTDYPYGERQYSVQDPGGHHWTFSESIKDFRPEDWGGTSYDLG